MKKEINGPLTLHVYFLCNLQFNVVVVDSDFLVDLFSFRKKIFVDLEVRYEGNLNWSIVHAILRTVVHVDTHSLAGCKKKRFKKELKNLINSLLIKATSIFSESDKLRRH